VAGTFAWSGARDGRYFVAVDGDEHPAFDSLVDEFPPTLSANGAHIAYGAYVDGQARLIVDGAIASEPGLEPIRVAFSPDGQRVAWVGRQGEGTAASQRVVLDGAVGQPHGRVIEDREWGVGLTFSRDSRHLVYAAVDTDGERVVVDGAPGPARLGIAFPAFSPDGDRFVHAARFPDGWSLIEDDAVGPRFWFVGEPVFSGDSRRLSYAGFLDESQRVAVIDGEAGPPFADIFVPGSGWTPGAGAGPFSPDGTRVAYIGQRRSRGLLGGERVRWLPIIDGRAGDEVDEIASAVTFSPDARSTAFGARTGDSWRMMVDGRPGPAFRGVLTPSFSRAGRLAYGAWTSRGWTVAVDHRPGPEASEITWSGHVATDRPFRWTADGEAVAWVGAIDGAWHPIVGEAVGPGYDDVKDAVIVDHRTIHFWAVRGMQVYLVTATLG
jgi:hypothetical protein